MKRKESRRLTRETFIGPWAGLPVCWTEDDRFDEDAYREQVARCCRAGIPGVYSGGTTGEFYAMEFDEFCEVARATVEECHAHGTPAMIGCTSTYTLGVLRRVKIAAELGADAIQIALPYWLEVASDQIVPFFREVSAEAGSLPLSIYETGRAKRLLTVDEHRAIADAVPRYLMVKATAGTVVSTVEGCGQLSRFVNVFVGEDRWLELGPRGVRGGCSSMVYWNPHLILDVWSQVEREEWSVIQRWNQKVNRLLNFLKTEFGSRGFTDTAYDRLGAAACGFLETNLRCRRPYISPVPKDVTKLRRWCRDHFPEMLGDLSQ